MAVASILPHPTLDPSPAPVDELTALTDELLLLEPQMLRLEAQAHALFLLDDCDGYAASWDSWAFFEGNDAALPF